MTSFPVGEALVAGVYGLPAVDSYSLKLDTVLMPSRLVVFFG